jgi:hypothetical protein
MELDLLEGLPEELAACFLLPTREMGWCCPCVNSIGSGRRVVDDALPWLPHQLYQGCDKPRTQHSACIYGFGEVCVCGVNERPERGDQAIHMLGAVT